MSIYNNPVITAIKNLIRSSKDGEMTFDPKLVNGILQRFLDRNVKFRGSISVRDDKNRLIFRYKKGRNVEFADPISLTSKILSELPKDGEWYKNPFHKSNVRYTPDSISYNNDEINYEINELYNELFSANEATFNELNSYVASTGNDPVITSDSIDYIDDSINDLLNFIRENVENTQDDFEVNGFDSYEMEDLVGSISNQIQLTMDDCLDVLITDVYNSGLTDDEKEYVTQVLYDNNVNNTTLINNTMNYIYQIASADYVDYVDSMDVTSGMTEEEQYYYDLGYTVGSETAALPTSEGGGAWYNDRSNTSMNIPDEYTDEYTSGYEAGKNDTTESYSAGCTSESEMYKDIDDRYKMFNIQKSFEYAVSNPEVLEIEVDEKNYKRGLLLAKHIKDDLDGKHPIIYVASKESGMSFVKGLYDAIINDKNIPLEW